MKKILAAVLAAAMALSMSAVAFAQDTQPEGDWLGTADGVAGGGIKDRGQVIGLTSTYKINAGGFKVSTKAHTGGDTTKELTATDLNKLLDDNLVVIDVAVSSGKNNLESNPVVKVSKDGTAPVMSVKFKDTWGTGEVDATVQIRITAKKDLYWGYDKDYDDFAAASGHEVITTNAGFTYTNGTEATADDEAWDNISVLKKGDTITLKKFQLKANYLGVTNYGENMTVTNTEVANKNIVANGESLYDNADSSDNVIIYFKNGGYDVAAYKVKVAPNQKNVNLAFNTKEDEALTKEYDKVEFEFINFESQVSGANKFNNSGVLYFNAIGDGDTCVYEVVDGEYVKLDTKYDPVDHTVYTTQSIKYLTSYVVASEELVQEEEPAETPSEPAEVDNTPVNPGTGAL